MVHAVHGLTWRSVGPAAPSVPNNAGIGCMRTVLGGLCVGTDRGTRMNGSAGVCVLQQKQLTAVLRQQLQFWSIVASRYVLRSCIDWQHSMHGRFKVLILAVAYTLQSTGVEAPVGSECNILSVCASK
jgi:hypothetical protein